MSFLKRMLEGERVKTDLFQPPSPPTADEVAKANAVLGITLPGSFVVFMQKSQPLKLPPCAGFYWVGPETHGVANIVSVNKQERAVASSPLPQYLVAFYTDGMGNQLCFDTRHRSGSGEYAIVFWDHELSSEENISASERIASNVETAGKVADSFQGWFDQAISKLQ